MNGYQFPRPPPPPLLNTLPQEERSLIALAYVIAMKIVLEQPFVEDVGQFQQLCRRVGADRCQALNAELTAMIARDRKEHKP